ncbi:AsmA-like C-terminal region-containing protein [Tenacibaculum sp. IB213877]|uniref:AsmA-like C-terminal region-containing protein n=1 Tax=Tenacibaculum sp. IB213877 TaxID=3097351 RepID=UPI002A5A04CC|nr:AsmA-like C-terminal region-containing protein [Tenacibaculum sp. IB213877]MDY0781304.1 AsmA-like C-terminal region-containing protein [Tenacibaculum sp. IB213877]
MKKVLKIVIGIVLFLVVVLAAIPFIFQDKLVALVKETINNNVNAKVEFANANLSLLSSFPKASVELNDVVVTTFKPFEGDTLVYGKNIELKLNITELFKSSSEQLNLNSFTIDNALVNIIVDENGNENYNIAKPDSNPTEEKTESSNFKLSLNSYAITNSSLKYNDKKGKMTFELTDFNHSGSGDFSEKNTELDTQTSTLVSFSKDDASYLKNQKLDLDAILAMDLENMKFSFLENEAHINQLPLIFNGFVKLNDNSQEVDIDFKTPSSDFRNFLALIPEQYAKNIADVKTTGDFSVTGKVNGLVTETTIPKLDISISSNNASFKYPDLPKSVQNIHINTNIKNTTGNVKNTFVTVDKLAFNIDKNTFNGKAKIENVTENPYINATVNGTIDLTDINKVYPMDLKNELSGVITANLTSSFDMDAIQNNKYQRIKNNGKMEVSNLLYNSDELANPIKINTANINFAPEKVSLTEFNAITGTSDLQATGSLQNLLGFLLSDKKLQGSFNLNSSSFKVGDFMAADKNEEATNEENQPKEKIKIPAFLDCVVNASAKEVHYDNLKLENVKGILVLKDEKATFKNVNGNMFGGTIALNGAVNTQNEKPVFDMKLGVQSFDISQSFQNIELFKALAPIASVLKGELNTNIDLSGNLKDDFTPNLTSLTGKALAEVLASNINPENSKALNLLDQKLNFVDLNKLNLKDIKTNLSFEEGKVKVKPFNLKYNDIDITVEGSHSFDELMNYNATFNVPAKYLGSEVTGLLSKLDAKEQNTTVPITANFSGSFSQPNVSTDLKSAVSKLTTQLIEKQKSKFIDKTLNSIIGTKKDSTQTEKGDKTVDKVKDVLGGLFGKKKKDTTKNK